MSVRLDKWLQVARIYKTRAQANRACSLGRIRVNGTASKPHRALAVGDRIELELEHTPGWARTFVVRELRDKPVPKAMARELYEDQSPPKPEVSELEKLMRRTPARRERGTGRPTKKDRRLLEDWNQR